MCSYLSRALLALFVLVFASALLNAGPSGYVNADDGKVVTTLPIGTGTDAAGFNLETGLAFSSNGDGTLTVMHEDSPDKYSVIENVTTLRRARTMALEGKTHQVYTVSAEFGTTPAPTAEQPRPRPPMPGTFTLLILSR